MRRFLALAVFAGAVSYGAPAAHACHLITPWLWYCWFHTYSGTADVNCFGCGTSTGTAELWFTPAAQGVTPANASAAYTVNEPAGATCVVSGTASGSVTGAINVSFNWTRVGAIAVVSTSGDHDGAGVAAFAVTSPTGVPCGGPITAQVAGALVGI